MGNSLISLNLVHANNSRLKVDILEHFIIDLLCMHIQYTVHGMPACIFYIVIAFQ